MGNTKLAIDWYKTLLQNTRDPLILVKVGSLCELLGNHIDALKYYTEVFRFY